MVSAYIYNMVVITKHNEVDQLEALEGVLQKLTETGLCSNSEKSFIKRIETDYLGFWVIKYQVIPLFTKVEAIQDIGSPIKVCDMRHFIGINNYHRYMCRNHTYTLSPLNKLWSTIVKFKWTDVYQNNFITMKKILSRYVILSYPIFSEEFIIHIDDRKIQIGGLMSQNGDPIASYSCNISPSKIDYTAT